VKLAYRSVLIHPKLLRTPHKARVSPFGGPFWTAGTFHLSLCRKQLDLEMMHSSVKSFLFVGYALVGVIGRVSAFSPALNRMVPIQKPTDTVLFSSEDTSESPNVPIEPMVFPVQPPVPPKRLDPLMATLTRVDPSVGTGPTRNVPLFGEVPVDGGLTVLVPAAVIAILGFLFSIVVAVNSADELVAALDNIADDIARTASEKSNMVYDENVCRGICSSQEEDLQGLANFMQSLRK